MVGLDRLVFVRWHDHWDEDTWVEPGAMKADAVVESVGIVVRETDTILTIAAHRGLKGMRTEQYGAPTNIWKVLIDEVRVIH